MRKPIVMLTVMVQMQLPWWKKMYYGNGPKQQNLKKISKNFPPKTKTLLHLAL